MYVVNETNCSIISKESDLQKTVGGLRQEFKGTNQRLERIYNQQETQKQEQKAALFTQKQRQCYQVFKISNHEEQKNVNPHRVPGTCQWVTQKAHYLHWWDNCTHDLLWISADPGCGKSVLARSLIDIDFKAFNSKGSVCYFFFKDNKEQNSLATALCAVLHQLFNQQQQLIRLAMPSWERNGDKLQHEVDELWRVLMSAASDPAFQNTICIFDTNRLRGEDENLKIRGEIDHVIKLKVQELTESLELSPSMQQKLEQQLLRMEHRTYLWLHLAINDVQDTFRNSLQPNEETIRLLPPSVTAAYQKILARVPPGQIATVKKILTTIVSACRPLSIEEMAMALGVAVSPQCGLAKDASLDPMGLGQKIRRLCGLFVFVKSSSIYLVHQTAKEFLIERENGGDTGSPYSFCLRDAHCQLLGTCLRYLLSGRLQEYNPIVTSRTKEENSLKCYSVSDRDVRQPEFPAICVGAC